MAVLGQGPLYHHTPPISLIYALREAMLIAMEEGLETAWERHRHESASADRGSRSMGLKMFVKISDV